MSLKSAHLLYTISLSFLSNFSDIDDCLGHNCIRAQTERCIDGINTFTCECITGYNGERCEIGEYTVPAKYQR